MKRISRSIFALKWLMPVFFIVIACGGPLLAWMTHPETVPPTVLVTPVVMVILMYAVMKLVVWDLADEVRDGGDYLFVRKGRIEERIPLSNIMNVSASTLVNPPRIELRLVEPNRLGDRVIFSPTRGGTLNPFARNAIAEDLMVRVDRARRKR